MKILYAFFCGMIVSGIYSFFAMFWGIVDSDPETTLWGMILTFTTGFVVGLLEYNQKMKKKAEEEERQAERQAEQDRTNELMREYLEKKLREEKENAE